MPEVHRDVDVAGHRLALLVTTHHGAVRASTAVHRQTFERRIGGVRFARHAMLEELAHLAVGMAEKAAAARAPVNGLKCVVTGYTNELDQAAKAAILAEHIRAVAAIDAAVVFGPDMGSSEALLSSLARAGLERHVTGLTREFGGVEINRTGLTAIGLVRAIEFVAAAELPRFRVAIQGFGAVGGRTARLLRARGATIAAVSTQFGTLRARGGSLHPAAAWHAAQERGEASLSAFGALGQCDYSTDPSAVFAVPADVFVPAARTGVLACRGELAAARRENPAVHAVEAYHAASGVRLVAEGANHPLTAAAEAYLEGHAVTVLPDVLVNVGGFIGCWYEAVRREELRGSDQRRARALDECVEYIHHVVDANLEQFRASGLGVRDGVRAVLDSAHRDLATDSHAFFVG